jgi:hypothetical protein
VAAVDHRFALGNPALASADPKKSFSSVNSPIFAWSVFTSIELPREWDFDAAFEFGVGLILDGVEAAIRKRNGEMPNTTER